MYRINPSNPREVQKQVQGRWYLEKKHATPGDAQRHLKALQINVMAKEK